MRVFAFIPARGGSKGIAKKNLQPVAGIPLVVRCVQAALRAASVHAVFVSTDDDEIAQAATAAGAEVIRRPADISGDRASSEAAVLHACDVWKNEGRLPDAIAFLQATSPFTQPSDLDGAVAQMLSTDADVVFSVAQYHRFQWQMDEHGVMTAIGHDQERRPRRQELANRYVETGALYLMSTAGFMARKFRFFGKVVGYATDAARMHEIDDPFDLHLARAVAPLLDWQSAAERLPPTIDAVVFDFDGVMTDDAVYVDETGRETIRASRRDGLGISQLRLANVPCLVLSKERNPVVSRRCEKLRIECQQGVDEKLPALLAWLAQNNAQLNHTVYVGNDVNDLECMRAVGFAVAVGDADHRVKAAAHWVCGAFGGEGAVREVCELLLTRFRG
jgi:YrbI family 3-deoxy-D-manno-octulosonate 8-phosphate phosphatase